MDRRGCTRYIYQNGCHFPSSKPASPETLTILTRFGLKLRERFKVSLGINLEEHDVEGLTAIARAIPLDFVRIKVYLGAMVKADGIVEGCADKLQRSENLDLVLLPPLWLMYMIVLVYHLLLFP